MAWKLGPLESWYGIHEALRSGFAALRKTAANAKPEDSASIEALVDEGIFVLEVLRTHSLGEDGVVFPMMRMHGLTVPDGLLGDHHRELNEAHDIAADLLTLRTVADAPVAELLNGISTRLEALERDLNAHLDFEEQSVIPACEALAASEQAAIIRGIGSTTPEWQRPRLQPWMFQHMPLELATAILNAWHSGMPADFFAGVARRLHDGMERQAWNDLRDAVPALAEGSAD